MINRGRCPRTAAQRTARRSGVVVLSQHADEGYAFALLKNGTGARACLLNERVIDPAVVEALLARLSRLSGVRRLLMAAA
jgi:hypothetical protein